MEIKDFDSLEILTTILGELSPTKDPYYEIFEDYVNKCESEYEVSNGFLISKGANTVTNNVQDLYKLAFEYVALKDQFGNDFNKFQELANEHFDGDILKIIAIRVEQKIPMSIEHPDMYLQYSNRKMELSESQKSQQFVGFKAYLGNYTHSK